jgi:hypothetical protein
MYLYTRRVQLGLGHQQDGMEWAVDICAKVNQITSLDVGLWTTMLSPGVGQLAFGCAVETLGDVEDAAAKLQADPMYVDAIQRGTAMLTGSIEDECAQYLVGDGELPFNPTHIAVVRSALANGHFVDGVAAGIEIAEKAKELGGLPTAFLLSTTGTYGGVGWITSAASLADLEKAEQATNTNPEFASLVDGHSTNYLPAATTQAIWRRIV